MDDSLWFSLLFTLFIQSFSTIEHQVFFALVNFAERRSEHSGFSSKKELYMSLIEDAFFCEVSRGAGGPGRIQNAKIGLIQFCLSLSAALLPDSGREGPSAVAG